MTIVTSGDERRIDQIEKQLFKLVDVAALQDITINRHLEREVVLVKVALVTDVLTSKPDLDRIVDAFNASLIDVTSEIFIVELSGSGEKVDELIKSLSNHRIIEVARSGVTGLASTERFLSVDGM